MRRALIPIGLVFASVLAAVVLCELVLRVIDFSDPIWYRPDPHLGWSLRPGMEGWYTKEGHAYIRINSRGLRDREHSQKKPDGVYRVAVLGDSQAEAFQVGQEVTFWSLLERELAECTVQPGKRIEVINFGVSGYGTAQEYLQLESIVIDYQPDLVLHLFTHDNDIVNNSIELEKGLERPYFRLDPQGHLILDRSWVETAAFKRRSSAVYRLARFLSDHLRVVQLVRSANNALALRRSDVTQTGNNPLVMAPPRDRAWEDAWAITQSILAKTKEFASLNGMQYLLVIGASSIQVHPDRRVRSEFEKRLKVNDLFYVERRIGEFAKAQGIDVIPLAYEMQRVADAKGVFFHGFRNTTMGVGHYNENGHRATAQIVARHLCVL
jgi:hypothetical protein